MLHATSHAHRCSVSLTSRPPTPDLHIRYSRPISLCTHTHAPTHAPPPPAVQKTWARRADFQIVESVKYYFNKIDEIMQPGYLASDDDILYARVRTSGIVTERCVPWPPREAGEGRGVGGASEGGIAALGLCVWSGGWRLKMTCVWMWWCADT
jgi:hypothetical protein